MLRDEVVPVLSCGEAADFEVRVLKRDPELEWRAMAEAGRGIGRAVLRDFREIGEVPERVRILVLAGKGHNAGDAFLAVGEILRVFPGAEIDLVFVFPEERLSPLAKRALEELRAVSERIRSFGVEDRGRAGGVYDICIDGIFGMNFRPPFRGGTEELIGWVNEEVEVCLRAAVDLPSGIGDRSAERAFRADFTYMTGIAKRPLFEVENAKWCGRLRYLELGFFEEERPERERRVLVEGILRPLGRLRGAMTHKSRYGHLLLVGGSRRMPGAILMSAMAAVRSGAGLVTAAVPESMVPAFAGVLPEVMWLGCPETEEGGLALDGLYEISKVRESAMAWVIGPGVGMERETHAFLQELVREAEVPVVIDAEALQPDLLERVSRVEKLWGKVVITPHGGEFRRISGEDFSDKGEEALLRYSERSGFLVLLKGPPFTRISDGKTISYVLPGGPVLARGGSGDLLAGMAGSLAARMPGRLELAVGRAALWHGLAAERVARKSGHEAVRTTELLGELSAVLREGFVK